MESLTALAARARTLANRAPALEEHPQQWWEGKRLLAGVFEGGGAKGVGYAGALQALARHGWWFGAVAGASAGAITALLVAAGSRPGDLEAATLEGLGAVEKPSRPRGFRRLALTGSYFDQRRLRRWLRARIAEASSAGGEASFEELWQATNIDLYVVAADVSAAQQIVFNRRITPKCSVVDAVIASAAIPGAFESGQLAIRDAGRARSYFHTVVDGGVWSNFPTFVFDDASFRLIHELPETPYPVLGFLLAEEGFDAYRARIAQLREASFEHGSEPLIPMEWRYRTDAAPRRRVDRPGFFYAPPEVEHEAVDGRPGAANDPGAVGRATDAPASYAELGRDLVRDLALLYTPFGLLQIATSELAPVTREPTPVELQQMAEVASKNAAGFWPQPKTGWVRLFVPRLDDALGSLQPWWVAAIVLLASVGAALYCAAYVVALAWETPTASWWNVAAAVSSILLVFAAALFLANAAPVAFAALAANTVLLRTIRRVGYGIARTYAAGPGAPPWRGLADNDRVIRLSVPEGLSTMAFEADPRIVAQAVDTAYIETVDGLRRHGLITDDAADADVYIAISRIRLRFHEIIAGLHLATEARPRPRASSGSTG
jgi:predicted acylesterase/phospholipase RssA